MRKEYREELKAFRIRLEKAEAFAKRLPLFAKDILEKKLTGEEENVYFGSSYKQLKLPYGIYRSRYKRNTKGCGEILGYTKEYDIHLFEIYINTLSEYSSHEEYGLKDVCNKVPVFHYDSLNSRFYCTDEQLGPLLEALIEWKINAVKKHKTEVVKEKRIKLEQEIKQAQDRLEELKKEQ